ncbi:MAG: sodium:proton antiporter NhaD [Syntrophorhabdaceae bacterium]|nr:sodium:proton antiporter NhaD [Syntrophorhabdaceae bacterium]
MKKGARCLVSLALLMALPLCASANGGSVEVVNLTTSVFGIIAVVLFIVAYGFVIFEEKLHLRKSKPVVVAGGIIWIMVALAYLAIGRQDVLHSAVVVNLAEYVELFLFLLAAMTYINALEERKVFEALTSWLLSKGFGLRRIYWMTGTLAFFLSPLCDNLTTALLMGAVTIAVARNDKRFIVVSCINIVVASNAGGAFSPFGDITTLMVWQKGKIPFGEFFALFIPSMINWLIPAVIMSFSVPHGVKRGAAIPLKMKAGARRIMILFVLTIVTAVLFHNVLHLPPALGMMLGLGYLSFFGYYLKIKEMRNRWDEDPLDMMGHDKRKTFDLFRNVARAEWDTLLFFYGIIFCVGGLGQLGYLAMTSEYLYGFGHTPANVMIGILSAVVDNIPVMYAVLTMNPDMSHGQWLLATLAAGVGGSLLSIGSAAGVGLMGSSRGTYTFAGHLKWTWAVGLGYGASIWTHLILNAKLFT